ncbi:MAG: universal stress protein [Desulfobulbus sp.]|jgi:nucleotide-binding universal stress UspA family protein|uniref:universal stress protein n=1 Tax=Desulfobulbus sp. TaxID=895 RepID=UPI00284CFF98|nr:universal stress protein [Desulfobulbus sp.]MDR2549563.1 universal stress protein [Desulfobulbus sp.]
MIPAPNMQTILFATDLGENSRSVFRLAVSQARRYNARLLILHVVEPLGSTGTAIIANYLSGVAADRINKDMAEEILDIMKQRVETFCLEELVAFGLDRTPVTEVMVASGNPAEEILETAKQCDVGMIVMGTSTRSFLGNAIMGTTARRVSRHTTVPVLLVPMAEK